MEMENGFKHLASIQEEFIRYASDSLDWWEKMNNQEQREYLKRHPGSRMRLTPAHTEMKPDLSNLKPGESGSHAAYESPDIMAMKRKIVQKMMRKLVRHPGDAHIDHTVDGDGNVQYKIVPGMPHIPSGHIVGKKNNQLFETDHDGYTPVNLKNDEAASKLRHHMGEADMSHLTRKKKPKEQIPELPPPTPAAPETPEEAAKRQEAFNAELTRYEQEHAKKYGPHSSAWD